MTPRMIFCVTAGRTGTTLLARLFSLIPGVHAVHEPRPDFAQVMRAVQQNPQRAHKFLTSRKIPAIAAIDEPVYVETSHLFCKGFFEPMLELHPDISIIVLERSAHEIAYSLLSRGTVPARTPLGRTYLLQPDDPGVLPIGGWEDRLTDYQLCYWYALEIERRQAEALKLCEARGVKHFRIQTNDLAQFDQFSAMCAALNIPLPEEEQFRQRFEATAGKKHNRNPSYLDLDEDFERQGQVVQDLIA